MRVGLQAAEERAAEAEEMKGKRDLLLIALTVVIVVLTLVLVVNGG